MPGLLFEVEAPPSISHPNRTDIALFVGFIRLRADSTIPQSVQQWLIERGWASGPFVRPGPYVRHEGLLDVPVPIENWLQFDQLFAWEQRSTRAQDGSTYLGAAVRSFFAQGGRKCYVVCAGDPLPLEASLSDRDDSIGRLIPGYPNQFECSGSDRSSWSGIGHLFGLPDVSFLCVPDLADATSVTRERVQIPEPPPGPKEEFAECSIDLPPAPPDLTVRDIGAPRCDETGYSNWANALNLITTCLGDHVRETQLVAALPLPDKQLFLDAVKSLVRLTKISQSTEFLQLAYPWVRTPGSGALPETLEAPDGVLTGLLARNALTRGTFRSAANLNLADVYDVYPQLGREQMATMISGNRLAERVSLMGLTSAGLRLISDVTMSGSQTYRPASVRRLLAAIVRTARRIGEDVTFEPSGETVWRLVRERLDDFLRGLFEAGAFRGESAADSYQVECDRSTMTQNDIDNGRVIAYLKFDAAAPIDTITVALTISDGRELAQLTGKAA
jgi:hypothetical protein